MKVDAVVVGARCAGAATAMLLARGGARVVLVDKGAYGTDMLSTHALMRGAVLQLDRWGVLPDIVASGTPPIRSTTFCYAESEATVPIEPKYGVTALYAPRRTLLDRLLVDAAFKSGVDIRYGVRVDDVKVDSRGRAIGISAVEGGRRREIDADIVIGADGLHSTIARQVRAPRIVEGRHATAVLYGYWEGLSADEYRWWFKPGVSMGSIPTNDGATCVFVSVPSARFRDEIRGNAALAYTRLIWQISRRFGEQLHDSVRVEPVRGFGGHRGFIKRGSGPGWALVGDAGYFKDPSTAHGITDAFRDAELLSRAIMRGTTAAFAEYEQARLDLSRKLLEVTDDVASLAWTDEEVQSLHRAFSAEMSRELRVLAALPPAESVAEPWARLAS
jgi:2-polyprenyl-6-methoxyphenol hydroxylase-like FAD-dependent oxidoreductase